MLPIASPVASIFNNSPPSMNNIHLDYHEINKGNFTVKNNEKLDCKHKCKDKMLCGHECCKRLSNFFSRVKRKREESRYFPVVQVSGSESSKYLCHDQAGTDSNQVKQLDMNYPFHNDPTFHSGGSPCPDSIWEKELNVKKMKPCYLGPDFNQTDMFGDDFGIALELPLAGEEEPSGISIRVAHEDDSSYDCAIEVLLFQSPAHYNETIEDVKRRIVAQVQDFDYANILNIFASEWWLGDVPLMDDSLVRDLVSQSFTSIICKKWPKQFSPPVNLVIHISDGRTLEASFPINQTIGHVKVWIESHNSSFNSRELALIYGDVLLEDTTLIESCSFIDGDHLECRLRERMKSSTRSYVKSIKPPANGHNQTLRIELEKAHVLVHGSRVDVPQLMQVVNSATGELIPGNIEVSNNMVITFCPLQRMKSARYRVLMQPKAFSNHTMMMTFATSDLTFPFHVQGEEHTLLCVAQKGSVATDCNICLSRTELDLYEELKLTIAATFGLAITDIIQLRSGTDAKYIVEEHNDVKRLRNKDRIWFILSEEAEMRWYLRESARR